MSFIWLDLGLRQCGIHRGRLDKWMEISETRLYFFLGYLSKEMTELIDMLHSEEIKISMGTRSVPGMTLGSLWPPEVSALIARVASGPSTVQNSLGRKWDTKLTESATLSSFVRDAVLYGS